MITWSNEIQVMSAREESVAKPAVPLKPCLSHFEDTGELKRLVMQKMDKNRRPALSASAQQAMPGDPRNPKVVGIGPGVGGQKPGSAVTNRQPGASTSAIRSLPPNQRHLGHGSSPETGR